MPDQTLVSSHPPGDVHLPDTLLVQLHDLRQLFFGQTRTPHTHAPAPQELDRRAAGDTVPLGKLLAARSGLVLPYQRLLLLATQAHADAAGWLVISHRSV